MKVHFYSITEDEKIDYISELEYIDKTYVFEDKALENTINYFEILDKHIKFNRKGSVSSSIEFKLNEKTRAFYKNNIGLEFDFYVYTKRLEISNSKITIEYDLFIGNEYQDTIKIYLIIK